MLFHRNVPLSVGRSVKLFESQFNQTLRFYMSVTSWFVMMHNNESCFTHTV